MSPGGLTPGSQNRKNKKVNPKQFKLFPKLKEIRNDDGTYTYLNEEVDEE